MLKSYLTLLPYWKSHRLSYLVGFIFLLITDAGQLFLPQLTRRIIDHLGQESPEPGYVLQNVLTIVIIAFFIALGRFGWRFFIHGASRRIERSLRGRLFDHLLLLSPGFYATHKTGDLMARATSDMNHVRMASGMGFVALFDGLFMTLFIILILIRQYPSIALYVLLPFPLLTLMVLGIGPFLGRFFRAVQEGYADLSSHVQEVLSGIRVIKSFTQEDDTVKTFRGINNEYKKRNMALVRLWGFFFPVIGFLGGLASLIMLRFGGYAVIDGTMSIGEMVAAFGYLGMLIWPMMGAGFTVNLIQRGAASLERINKVLDEKPDIASAPGALKQHPAGDIEIRHLDYSYQKSDELVLEDIDLVIPAGTTLGILGRTGSGKSTLIRILPRLIDPPKGKVFINGRDVHDYELSMLRAAIGMVPQETFLFSATIGENIAFACPDASSEDIADAARLSTIDRDFSGFPLGIDTLVGERGVTLSGGQKQRIAISRAILADPDILVFDDALSAVDTATEEEILTAFLEMRRGKSNILISHRVSTLQHADQIVVLEKGRIVQQGRHQDLAAVDGFYREIHLLQKLEEEEGGQK